MADNGGVSRLVTFGGGPITQIINNGGSGTGTSAASAANYSALRLIPAVAAASYGVAPIFGAFAVKGLGAIPFVWSATETRDDNNCTVIRAFDLPNGNAGAWVRPFDINLFNPKWTGCRPGSGLDDRANFQAAIVAAINEGMGILMPEGEITIDGGLLLPVTAEPMVFVGSGPHCILRCVDTETPQDDVFSASGLTSNVVFHNFKIDARGAARILDIGGSDSPIDITRMEFTGVTKIPSTSKGTAGVITLIGCSDVTFDTNKFYGNGEVSEDKTCRTYTILSSASTVTNKRWKVRNQHIISAGTTNGISLFDTEDVEIVDCYVDQGGVTNIYDGSGGDGYGIFGYNHYLTDQDPKKFIVSRCQIKNTPGNGIYIQTIRHAKVTENILSYCGLVMPNGISLLGAAIAVSNSVSPFENAATVTNNTIIGGYRDAISVGGNDNLVENNTIFDISDVGIRLGGTTSSNARANHIERTLGRAAWLRSFPFVSHASTIDHTDHLDLIISGTTVPPIVFQDTDTTQIKVLHRIRETLKTMVTAVSSFGSAPPVCTLTGTANQPVSLRIVVKTSGARGTWTGQYCIDDQNYKSFTSSASSMSIVNPLTGVATGLSVSFANTSASTNNIWTARAHYGFAVANICEDEEAGVATHLLIQARDFGLGSYVQILNTTAAGTLTKLGLMVGTTATSSTLLAFVAAGGLYNPGGATNAIWAYGTCTGGEISHNTIKSASASGVFITAGQHLKVIGNEIEGSGSQQIAELTGNHNLYTLNKCKNGLNHGIDLRGTDGTFHGNECIGNAVLGVNDGGTRNIGFYNKASGNLSGNLQESGATNPIRPDPNGAILPLTASLTVGHVSQVTTTSKLGLGYITDLNIANGTIAGTKTTGNFGALLVQTTGGFGSSGDVTMAPGGGAVRFTLSTSSLTYSVPLLICHSGQGSFQVYQDDQTDGVTDGKQATWRAQTSNATNGGGLDIKSGVGATNPGLFRLYAGASLRMSMNGTGLAFFSVAPVARASALTQTYATTTRTHSNMTSANLVTTAATNVTPYGFGSQAQADDIATEVNALRADVINLKGFVNALVDDLQAYGLEQ